MVQFSLRRRCVSDLLSATRQHYSIFFPFFRYPDSCSCCFAGLEFVLQYSLVH